MYTLSFLDIIKRCSEGHYESGSQFKSDKGNVFYYRDYGYSVMNDIKHDEKWRLEKVYKF